jgi:hypothetical protein
MPRNEEEYRVHRVRIGGVVVRYVEDDWTVTVTVEGALPGDVIEKLASDLVGKLESIERTPIRREVISHD